MMIPACWRAQGLLARRASGLGAPERLHLEEHLSGCAECALQASILDRMTEALRSEQSAPTSRARPDRAVVSRALLRGGSRRPETSRPPRLVPVLAVATVLGVAAVSFAWSQVRSRDRVEEAAPVEPTPPPADASSTPRGTGTAAPVEPPTALPSPAASAAAASATPSSPEPAPLETPPSASAARGEAVDVDARIVAARRLLAAGRAGDARALLEPLLARRLAPRQHAEARSLFAECAQAEGDHAAAAKAYGEVATRHGDTLAGETALFAQARAQMRAGDRAGARATLGRYLQRFPEGRFRKDALEHLRKLGEGPSP